LKQIDKGNSKWMIFQALVALGFILGNIHYGWGVDGMAISVIGGMVAWYLTGLLGAVFDRVVLGRALVSRGQLDDFREAAAEAKRQRLPPSP
jgi:DMSO/TMAO reductase YedYZ heme-binding membrane subunit